MLERAECRIALILLSVFSLLPLVITFTALVLSIVWKYTGFMINLADYLNMCSTYSSLKLQSNLVLNFSAIFIGGCASALFQITVISHLVYLLVKYGKSKGQYFKEFTPSMFIRLYLGYSLSLLGICISVGYYGSYIIQYRWGCLGSSLQSQLILGSLFAVALIFLLICWIIILYFWITKKIKFEQVMSQNQVFLDPSHSSGVEQPNNMLELFETLKEALKKQSVQTKQQVKQPLLSQSADSDRPSQQIKGREKLQIVTLEEYKKREEQKEKKQKQENEIILKLMKQEEERMREQHQMLEAKLRFQRIRRQKFGEIALSPDDPNFEQMLAQSDNQNQIKEQQSMLAKLKDHYFPLDFVPKNDKQRADFQRYKKKLLKKHKKDTRAQHNASLIHSLNGKQPAGRHPQNIEGGRSKSQLQKYIKQNKKPSRNHSLYLPNNVFPKQAKGWAEENDIISQQSDEYDGSQQKSAQFKKMQPQIVVQQIETPTATPKMTQQKQENSNDNSQVLHLHKPKVKSKSRKKLFQQQQKYLAGQVFSSILGTLVKGVEQVNMKIKLKQLRQKRFENQGISKSRLNAKLIQSIRSKFS